MKESVLMNSFKTIWYSLDLFKTPIYFQFNSKSKIPSNCSFFISVCIIGFLLAFFFQSDLFAKKSPFSSIQTIATNARPRIDFNTEIMGVALSLTDTYNVIQNDDSIYTWKIINYYVNSNGDIIDEDIKTLGFCNESDFKTHGDAFKNIGLKDAICPTTGNFSVEGYWDEKYTRYVEITINKCNNLTSPIVCKSNDEIFSFFQDKYMSIYFSDNIIDVNDFENPIKQIYKTKFYLMDSKIAKKYTFNFKKVEFLSDDGLIFANQKKFESFSFGDIDQDFMTDNLNWVGTMLLYSSSETFVIDRRYQKLQEVIASLGGLANSLLIMGFFITYLEKEFILFKSIINRLYIFPSNEKPKSKREPSKILSNDHLFNVSEKHVKMPSMNNYNKTSPKISTSTNISSGRKAQFVKMTSRKITKISETKSKGNLFKNLGVNQQKDVAFTFLEFLKIKYRPSWVQLNRKELLVTEALKLYQNEIDILSIIQKINEIDKMKMILFNENQIKLFNLMAKPTITLKGDNPSGGKNKMFLSLKTIREVNDGADLNDYYLKIKQEGQNASEIDQRLVGLIDEKSNNIFP